MTIYSYGEGCSIWIAKEQFQSACPLGKPSHEISELTTQLRQESCCLNHANDKSMTVAHNTKNVVAFAFLETFSQSQ